MAEHTIFGLDDLPSGDFSTDPDLTPIRVGFAFYTYDAQASLRGGRIWIENAAGLDLAGCWGLLYRINNAGSGTLLTAKEFPELVTGWNEVTFDAPVVTDASVTGTPAYYVFAVYMPNGGFSYKPGSFSTTVVCPTWDALIGAYDGEVAGPTSGYVEGNGVYRNGALTDPVSDLPPTQWDSFNANGYGVDIIADDVVPGGEDEPRSVFGSSTARFSAYSSDTASDALTVGTVFHVEDEEDTDWVVTGGKIYEQNPSNTLSGSWMYLYRLGTPNVLLAAKAMPSPLTKNGFTEAVFDVAAEVAPGNYYAICVYLPNGGFCSLASTFNSEVDSPDDARLKGTATGESPNGNGVFKYGTIADPSTPGAMTFSASANGSHYGVDVLLHINEITDSAPVNSVAPALTGVAETGRTLSCTTGTWAGTPAPTFEYQWLRGGGNISGATASTYVLTESDESAYVTCRVTATNTEGSASEESNGVTPTPATKLSIAEENELPSDIDPGEMDITGAGDLDTLGFCREFSLNVGETAHFAVDGTAVEIDIVRVGWYGGDLWRRVETIANDPVDQPDPVAIPDSNGGVTCSAWTDTASWQVPSNATPGYYLAVIRSNPGPNASFAPFIVRDDDRDADIMVKSSDATWALAYNYYGTPASPDTGKCLYGSGGPVGNGVISERCHAVSYHRPIVTREGTPQTYPMFAEFPLVRYLEQMGFDVTYSASKDWRADGPAMADCSVYVSVGHDEYWSVGMNSRWKSLRAAGRRLLFMSGNERFWRTRFDDELGGGGGGDVMWCFKDTMPGPGGHVAGVALDPVTWTGTWKDTRPANDATREPEWALTGTDFRMNGVNYRSMVVAAGSEESGTPFWRNTDVDASGLTVGDFIGMEADEPRPLQPDGSWTLLAQTTVNIDNNRADDNGQDYGGDGDLAWGIVLQRYSGGGVVVGFGTCTASWALDNNHDVAAGGSATRATSRFQQAMWNLLVDLGVTQPDTPIDGLVQPTAVALSEYAAAPPAAAAVVSRHDGEEWVAAASATVKAVEDGAWEPASLHALRDEAWELVDLD